MKKIDISWIQEGKTILDKEVAIPTVSPMVVSGISSLALGVVFYGEKAIKMIEIEPTLVVCIPKYYSMLKPLLLLIGR